jgi:hypothetical protein
VSLDPRDTGLGAPMQFFYFHPQLGLEFIKNFWRDGYHLFNPFGR